MKRSDFKKFSDYLLKRPLRLKIMNNNWISVSDKLPKPLQTVWITNGKGWTNLGCLVETPEGWHWAESNGVIYQEDGEIVSECESDDLEVIYWHELPNPPKLPQKSPNLLIK